MPQGEGTYGKKRGRPSKKAKETYSGEYGPKGTRIVELSPKELRKKKRKDIKASRKAKRGTVKAARQYKRIQTKDATREERKEARKYKRKTVKQARKLSKSRVKEIKAKKTGWKVVKSKYKAGK